MAKNYTLPWHIILCNGKSPVRLFHKSPSLFPIWPGYDIIFKVFELAQILLKKTWAMKRLITTDNFVSDHGSLTSYSSVLTMQTVICQSMLKMKMLSVRLWFTICWVGQSELQMCASLRHTYQNNWIDDKIYYIDWQRKQTCFQRAK